MTCLFRWQGQTLQGVTDAPVPGTTGYGDIGSATGGEYATGLANIVLGTYAMTNRTVPRIRFVDNAFSGTPHWDIVPGAQPNKATPPTITGPYSMRFYFRQSSSDSTVTQPIVAFYSGGSINWQLSSVEQTRPAIAGVAGPVAAMTPATGMFRFEVQVDPARSPSVVVRIYFEDETTPHRSTSASPANVSFDRIRIGHYFTGNFAVSEVQYAEMELHDDYDLGGQFTSNPASPTSASTSATGVASTTPTVAARFNWDSATNRTLPAATLVAGTHYTATLDQNYTTAGTFNRRFDLYQPVGIPPSGGWPVVLWAHSGFFSDGARTDLPPAWRDDLLNAGYAVATLSYVRTSPLDALAPYDSYGDTGEFRGARYPSMVLDYKRCGAWLRDKASVASGGDGTYANLNGDKLIASGYSAGGYLALGAAVTRGLAADSAGNPMTLNAARLAGNAWADGYTGPDPEFAGVFVYCAPINMDLAAAWDPTWPNAEGVLQVAYRAFQGLLRTGNAAPAAPHTSIASHIALNAANVPKIVYVRGTADYLVHWEHAAALSAAMTANGLAAKYTEFTTPNNHRNANTIYDRTVDLAALASLIAPQQRRIVIPHQNVAGGSALRLRSHTGVDVSIVGD